MVVKDGLYYLALQPFFLPTTFFCLILKSFLKGLQFHSIIKRKTEIEIKP